MTEKLLRLLSPRNALLRALYRAPLLLWRMGLGGLLPRSMLVLTTRGRRSGRPRHTMLERLVHEEQLIIGSAWGRRSHWARNLAADPVVSVATHRGGVMTGRATPVTDPQTLRRLEARLLRQGIQGEAGSLAAGFLFWRIEPAQLDAPPSISRDLRRLPPLALLAFVLLLFLTRPAALP